ncbi:MAG: hypothetical protein K9G49_16175 [Taibaiella sp.]|nr:hypothetical protein [Taibaiella sp.]
MNTRSKPILLVLLILNLIVLMGQVWPEGAPPFARYVNVIFLVFNLIFCIALFLKKRT